MANNNNHTQSDYQNTNNTAGSPRTPKGSPTGRCVDAKYQYRQDIANTIYMQLGGDRFAAMTGAKNLVALDSGLQFALPSQFARDGINLVHVILTPADTYTVRAFRRHGMNLIHMQTVEGVYSDTLRETFTSLTSLDTYL